MQDSRPKSTPLCPYTLLEKVDLSVDQIEKMKKYPYQELLGKINYIANSTRPELSVAVSKLSQFSNNPAYIHWNQLLHILKYLKFSTNEGIYLQHKNNDQLIAYSDSDWAGDKSTRKSTTGYTILMGKSLLCWKSQLQQTVAHSTLEAEFKAMAQMISTLIWCKGLLEELKMIKKNEETNLYCDNNGTIKVLNNKNFKGRCRHNEIHFSIVREQIEEYFLKLHYVETENNVADMFTKQLNKIKLCKLKNLINCRV